MRWLNYQHLFYFWNVAKCGSVTEASRRLRLAQPTISVQLKTFEDIIGEQLFAREGRNLRLTEAGQLAYRYAEQIFSLGQEFLDVLDGKFGGGVAEIKIGISDVVPKSLAYHLIEPAFDPEFKTTVQCSEDKTERLLADLAIGEIDLVIADRPIPPNVKVKAFNHFIGECGVTFLAARPLAKLYRKNFPQSLSRAPLLLPTAESAVRSELGRWFETLGFKPNCVGAFQDRALMKLAARECKGVIPVPSVIEAEVRRELHLEFVGSTDDVKEQIYLISVDRRLKSPVIMRICAEGQKKVFAGSR